MLKRSALVFASVLLLSACADDALAPKSEDISRVFWNVTNDIKAATVAVGGTQQLRATPRNAAGEVLDGLPAATFRSVDTLSARVDASGLVTGVAVAPSIAIIASITAGGITNVDTTIVAVTAQRQAVKSLSLDPYPTDSTKLGVNSTTPIRLTVKDSSEQTVTGLAVYYRVSNRNVGYMLGNYLRGISRGTIDVVATTTSYGVSLSDTVQYTVTYQKVAQVQLFGSTSASALFVGKNAVVTWSNFMATPANIVFQDSTNVPGGNISNLFVGLPQSRKFSTAGVYPWTNSQGSEAGTVTVLDD